MILDVLPGSELWDNLKGKFKPNWGKNSYREPEWIPAGLSKEFLIKAQEKAFRQFYLRLSVLGRLVRLIKIKQIKFLVKRLKDYRLIGKS
ncbi:MAG: hypothetical protein UT63_C0020G0023 [Candidatus Gottesmanbacteria bacterium GW2011_GWC2_39_8]|uniref:Uncharacterized protein n=1 Tax=Candidatus Gottesmanbacteria bacterium GW2011_GWC2_39_8 TaxID=1618450 RepID=A0A0G0PZ93_9BACT|nr:MAG: hypothetical protein UT63_C0020G0023 [Candidatus Gottesmanbacteria bacterium GW2011_GWC2_39_8]